MKNGLRAELEFKNRMKNSNPISRPQTLIVWPPQ